MLKRNRRSQHFKTSEATTAHSSSLEIDRLIGIQMCLIGASQNECHSTFTWRAEHVLRQGIGEHRRIKNFLFRDWLAPPGHRVLRTIAESLFGNFGQTALGNSVLVHVAIDLHTEELCRQCQAGCAIPVAQTGALGINAECSTLMLVKTDCDTDIKNTGSNGVVGGEQSRSTCCATIGHIDELQTSESQLRDHRVGCTCGLRAAKGELHVIPFQPSISTGAAYSDNTLIHARNTFGATKFVHSDSYNCHFNTHGILLFISVVISK